MSDIVVKAKKLLETITPGDWSNTHIFDGEEVITGPQTNFKPNYVATATCPKTAQFIAASPKLVRELIREVELLREHVPKSVLERLGVQRGESE